MSQALTVPAAGARSGRSTLIGLGLVAAVGLVFVFDAALWTLDRGGVDLGDRGADEELKEVDEVAGFPEDAAAALVVLLRTFCADAIVNINSATLYRAMQSLGPALTASAAFASAHSDSPGFLPHAN